MRVAVIGLWHQGIVAAACLAEAGYQVAGADRDAAKIGKLAAGQAPLFEPGLDDLLAAGIRSGRLSFSTDLPAAADGADVVIVAHDTPVNERDESDLAGVLADVESIAARLRPGALLHVTAQVPVGTSDLLAERIRARSPAARFGIAYSPENLRLGQAIERYRKPPLPVLGADDPATLAALESFYAFMGVKWERTSLRTAEMSKHALNGFLALSITFANELGNLCDEVGADGHRLAEVLRLEPRIGSKAMLFPGLGFSGGTLARDLQTLRGLGDRSAIETPLLDGTWTSNQQQNQTVVRRLKSLYGGSLAGRRVCVLGLTYKADTSTLRRSAALEVIADLLREKAIVSAHDPKADREELRAYPGFTLADTAVGAAAGADALVLMTPWAEYRALDFAAVKGAMKGRIVFDTAGLWKADAVRGQGLEHLSIGRGERVRSV